jgi:hypothetical protein
VSGSWMRLIAPQVRSTCGSERIGGAGRQP